MRYSAKSFIYCDDSGEYIFMVVRFDADGHLAFGKGGYGGINYIYHLLDSAVLHSTDSLRSMVRCTHPLGNDELELLFRKLGEEDVWDEVVQDGMVIDDKFINNQLGE